MREGDRLVGRPYDARFEWGARRVYCSELVFLVFELFPYGYVKQACKIAGMRKPRSWSTG